MQFFWTSVALTVMLYRVMISIVLVVQFAHIPDVDSLIVNSEDAAQAVKVVEGRPVPGEDAGADAVGRGVGRLQQPPIASFPPHNRLLRIIGSELVGQPTAAHG